MSWIAEYWATKGLLIGGVKRSQSCRYQTRDMAKRRVETVLEAHGFDGRTNLIGWRIVESKKHPEIFVHCRTATAVGCKCPDCGVKLSREDAEYAS